MSSYRKDFDKTKYVSFLIKYIQLLEKYDEIWEKVKNSLKKEFDGQPVYNEKHLEVKIKSYNGKINTNSQDNKIPKEGSQFVCLLVILIDSAFKTGKNYYPKCKCPKNVNMFLRKNRFLSILLMYRNFF